MARKGVDEAEQRQVIKDLALLGLVDDRQYARSWVHTRDALAPRGAFVLSQELKRKGISQDIIKEALAERAENESLDDEQIKRLVKSRERLYAGFPEEVRKRRLLSFLQRRGFSYGSISRILNA